MTDAPERIWLDGDAEAGDGYYPRCFETSKPCSEPAICYIRADIHEAEVVRLKEALADYQTALIWCSGSEDFQSDGEARAGWLKLCAPLLQRPSEASGPISDIR